LPWHLNVNWQLSALDSAIGKIAVTNARIKLENLIFLLAQLKVKGINLDWY